MTNYSFWIIDGDPMSVYITKSMINTFLPESEMITFSCCKACLKELTHPQLTLPHLILLDLNLSVMDGLDFLDSISEKLELKIAILSSSEMEKDIITTKKYSQVIKYLVKPLKRIDLENLLAVIK